MANLYRVQYGFFDNKKRLMSDVKVQDVLATDDKESTIKAVFTSNSVTKNGQTLEIISIQNAGNAGGTTFIQ